MVGQGSLRTHFATGMSASGRGSRFQPSSAGPQHERSGDHANGNDASDPPPPSPTTEQIQRGLEQVFEDSDDDPSWSRGAEQHLFDGLDQALDGRTALASVECNGTLCRIESDHDDMWGL